MSLAAARSAVLLSLLLLGVPTALARPLGVRESAQEASKLRVLAIGDSITAGSVPTKNLNHPYTIELASRLKDAFPNKEIDVDNAGVGGAGIYAVGFSNPITLLQDSQQQLDQAKASGIHYDYVVVMLGINDLLREGRSADDVKAGLLKIWEQWLESGSNVIAIPPFAAPGFVSASDSKEGERKKLADEIGKAAIWWKNNRPASAKFIPLDLEATVDFYAMPDSERSTWLDDGLHFTESGYNRLGDFVADAIIKAVKKS